MSNKCPALNKQLKRFEEKYKKEPSEKIKNRIQNIKNILQ